MKSLVISLLKRNALVVLAFMLLLIGIRLVPRGFTLPWLVVPIAFTCGLLWANGILIRRGHPILAVLLSLLLLPIGGLPALIGSFVVGRSLVEWEYKAQGIHMVDGCNGGAANQAYFEIHTLEQRLAELTNSPNADTNVVVQLQKAYLIAEEKERFLSDDCRRRGHCDAFPWKTNWGTIKQALTASDEALNQ